MANSFALILVLLTLVTGIVWVIDKVKWAKKRKLAYQALQEKSEVPLDDKTLAKMYPENPIVENARSLFPVIAIVFVLRSFIYEPFQIPSGSMMPTLLVGDFILVEKFSYGIKEPIWQNTIIPTGTPERGDVAVFKYPEDQRVDFIKRVVGLPGDRIVYKDKQLYLIPACGEATCGDYKKLDMNFLGQESFKHENGLMDVYSEILGKGAHQLLINPSRRDQVAAYYQQKDVATYAYEWVVPEGNYFVMGDNRDNSRDSRYWGFVPERNLVGKAVAKWISFEFDRGADSFLPNWVPSNVRFERIGSIK
ncbi:signal peptidase I [Psychromonas sp. RZ22]|uniref:signal peptidase I n=1 Tax=Psychromonas algarum TaxID=2555643 RepID=UPI0010684531|nr:signal peptidase I [Psychromonas sp. RZ22]TEW53476.1 signal peptidase I [Psychromonas sp. RZ22]